GEKDGTVTNSERRISRQRAFLPAPKQAKADWWAVAKVAKKLGFSGFDFSNACDIFNEHAALSAHQNATLDQRDQVENFRYFNLKGLMNLSLDEYDHLRPIQWPVWEKGQSTAVEQLFDQGLFSHKSKKAKLIPTVAIDPVHAVSQDYPLVLNTGRIRDQWHTMTRTGLSANLTTHRAEPFCEIHPNDALKFGIRDKALVEVKSQWGSCVLRVTLAQGVRRGQIFAPIHWTEQVASDARVGKVVNPVVDAISGEPEFKHTPVAIQPFHTTWQGVLYVRDGFEQQIKTSLQTCAWWAKVKIAKAVRFEIADRHNFDQTQKNLKSFLPFVDETYEWLSIEDVSAQMSHSIILKDGILIASLYIAPSDMLPDRDWVASLFKRERLSALHRKALLAGMPMSAANNDGPLVCSCFKVGKNKIIEAIKTQNITHEKQVTACLKAGGNCGSCLPEIRGLIKTCQLEAEA
ncbi:MAG: molybdopterin dinucleotide binding domain-containing protein, partial [Acinetobacter junii]